MLSAALPLANGAQSLRCGDRLVQAGDSKVSVLGKCGEPVLKDSFCKPFEPSATPWATMIPCETVDEWTDNPASGKVLTRLRFEQGVLRSLANGDRVP